MRFYRSLLGLYPASFRGEYCDELCFAFAERTRELSGPLVSLRIILAALSDVIPNAIGAHWDVLRQDLGYAARGGVSTTRTRTAPCTPSSPGAPAAKGSW